MIAKRVRMKSEGKSDYAGLVRYLTNSQNKNERVGQINVTNCQSDRADIAAIEILNTQAQNSRAKADKTYHLIFSFAQGEAPEDAVLKAIEEKLCQGLGYGEHQRVSVVHHDTDILHVHVAINKIHPTRYTIHEPYRDYRTLGSLCESIEREFGLKSCNHKTQRQGSENLADDMEHQAGIESLLGWIKRTCADQIQAAQSWQELHAVLSRNGLELRERGNGFVFTSDSGVSVKASSVDRAFSKAKLESRFGAFLPMAQRQPGAQPKRRYEKKPLRSSIDTSALYATYRSDQAGLQAVRASEWSKAMKEKNRLIDAAKRDGRLKRAAIKMIAGTRLEKKILYVLAGKALKSEIERVNLHYLKERQEIFDKHRRRTWVDWLRGQAAAGDAKALKALRARGGAHLLSGDTLTGDTTTLRGEPCPEYDGVTKKGTIIYHVGATAMRDDGERLQVSRGANAEGLQAALEIAARRFGQSIHVNGTDVFKKQIVRAAVDAGLAIQFDDAALEAMRRALLQPCQKENNDEQTNGRRTAGRGDGGGGAGRATGAAHGRPAAWQPGAGDRAAGHRARPDADGIGTAPPPAGRDRLRKLSELGVVRLPGGIAVLLPGNVSGHLEQQGAAADHVVRRGLSGIATGEAARAAAERYLFEREQKRCKGFDIPKHVHYDGYVGPAEFAGLRQVDNQALALLKRGQEILVVPVDDAAAKRLERLSVGQGIAVQRDGHIRKKGRSR